MTAKPKSFTTVIEWFYTKDKLPDKGEEIIFYDIRENYDIGIFDVRHFLGSRAFEIKNIKYWAYLPTLSEIE